MAKILTKGVSLQFAGKLSESMLDSELTWVTLPGLQNFPDLGGDIDNVDVTTLADSNYQYIKGLQDYGELEFTFVYDTAISLTLPTSASFAGSNFKLAKILENPTTLGYNYGIQWRVLFPDGTTFGFTGETTATPVGAGVNDAIQFTLAFALSSDISTSAGVWNDYTPGEVVATPAGGRITDGSTVTLTAKNISGSGAIYYSLDGADYEKYSAAIAVSGAGAHTIVAFATRNGINSATNTFAYSI